MRVLVACEFSGVVRNAFAAKGCDAWSCDILPSESLGSHYQRDVREVLDLGWDLMIAHPPCTYLCSSGLHWNRRRPERKVETAKALEFVKILLEAPIQKIALENPVGCISTNIRKPDQIIQPYQYGHNASKKTCLWLKNLAPLSATVQVPGTVGENGKIVWANQTSSGQNKLAPSQDRWKLRSLTYPGIAAAMAEQWTAETLEQLAA